MSIEKNSKRQGGSDKIKELYRFYPYNGFILFIIL